MFSASGSETTQTQQGYCSVLSLLASFYRPPSPPGADHHDLGGASRRRRRGRPRSNWLRPLGPAANAAAAAASTRREAATGGLVRRHLRWRARRRPAGVMVGAESDGWRRRRDGRRGRRDGPALARPASGPRRGEIDVGGSRGDSGPAASAGGASGESGEPAGERQVRGRRSRGRRPATGAGAAALRSASRASASASRATLRAPLRRPRAPRRRLARLERLGAPPSALSRAAVASLTRSSASARAAAAASKRDSRSPEDKDATRAFVSSSAMRPSRPPLVPAAPSLFYHDCRGRPERRAVASSFSFSSRSFARASSASWARFLALTRAAESFSDDTGFRRPLRKLLRERSSWLSRIKRSSAFDLLGAFQSHVVDGRQGLAAPLGASRSPAARRAWTRPWARRAPTSCPMGGNAVKGSGSRRPKCRALGRRRRPPGVARDLLLQPGDHDRLIRSGPFRPRPTSSRLQS